MSQCKSITITGKTTKDTWPTDAGSIKSSPYVQAIPLLTSFFSLVKYKSYAFEGSDLLSYLGKFWCNMFKYKYVMVRDCKSSS